MNENNLYNFFDAKTKKVLIACQKIAKDLNTITGTDHLLLALLLTPGTKSQQLLGKYLSDLDSIKYIVNVDQYKETKTQNKDISIEFELLLKLAIDNTIQKNNAKIAPEDLLWAIINLKKCSANKILRKLGIDIQKLKGELDNPQQNPKISNFYNPNNDIFPEQEENPYFPNQPFTETSKKNALEEFGTDLTNLAKNNQLDPVIGRQPQIMRLIQILSRKTKNNPILIGDPGVGKTAIVEGLAQKIASGDVPAKISNKKIISLDLALLVSGTMYRGQFENRVKKLLKEIRENKNIILFIDEIHSIVGAGSAEGSMDIANILKPMLAKGEIRLIGSTTYDEYRKHIEKDTALERRLQKVQVDEPSTKETAEILEGLKKEYEKYHEVTITNEAIRTAITLSKRYINDRFLPDKAIDLIDEAAASKSLGKPNKQKSKLEIINKKLSQTLKEKELSIDAQDFAKAAYLRSQELKLKQEIAVLQKKNKEIIENRIITDKEIAQVVSNWMKIPIDNLIKENISEIKNIEQKLSKIIIGQNEAINKVSKAIKKSKALLSDPNKPIGSFIFLGPTGVGKTHLAQTIAKIIYGSSKSLIKIDMSEFMERHNISRLVGAPPGYVGYDDAGKLTESVRNNPYSVVLFDEIEKAHPEVFNILLQILEDGHLTDAKGKKVNFKNTIIIMTSNIGVDKLNKLGAIGFDQKESLEFNQIKDNILSDLKKRFKPEFLNRLTEIIVFNPLDKEQINQIVKIELNTLKSRLEKLKISLNITDKAIKVIAEKSYNPEYGAREIKRIIDKKLTNPISEKILENKQIKEIIVTTLKEKIIIKTN